MRFEFSRDNFDKIHSYVLTCSPDLYIGDDGVVRAKTGDFIGEVSEWIANDLTIYINEQLKKEGWRAR